MLKHTLTTLDGLKPEFAAEYKKVGDVYVLDTDVVFEDVTPLKNSLLQERDAHKATKTAKAAIEATVADLTTRAGSAGDLEKSWQAKLDAKQAEFATQKEGLTKQLHSLLVDNVAQSIAAEISTVPSLMLPHITKRLTVAEEDGKYITRILGDDGKVTALSVNELKESIRADKQFAPIVTASKASGGGANGGKGGGGATKSFKEMNEAELTALHTSNPTEFNRLAAEAKAG